ncbi:unnamed protein product, partial [marine sediment metagenome]
MIDIEIESADAAPTKELKTEIENIAELYAHRFLKQCRAKTKQFLIDPKARRANSGL